MKECEGFVLVFSLNSKSSFDYLQNLREKIILVRKTEEFPLILFGNKVDLEEERVVSKKEGEELAKKWKFPFIETSAKKKINVDQFFSEISIQILKKKETKFSKTTK